MFENIEPLHTKVEKVISTRLGNIILENSARFPLAESNLYCTEQDGRIRWRAEKPAPDALYTRVKLNEDGETLSAYTLGGHACELDISTGKLLSQTTMQ
jgi:hypothetical protein